MTLSTAMENRMLLLVLTLVPGIGPARIKALTRHLPELTDVLHTGVDDLLNVPGIGESLACRFTIFFTIHQQGWPLRKAQKNRLPCLTATTPPW